uniref:Actin-related protein 3 n=1 Tax=Favella ehrenbergii TaxID=182087 RepID=A0A7S3I390_9SPIT|mmetsp:Transcript_10911/g.14712  ORF Transcript_10911/g.14712 Transcript_10911/m.14712 type:complete len:317 (+) Transcript_10911:417-1367(+)
MNTPENREQMAEIMFETFNVKGLFIGVQATLALYAQVANTSEGGGASRDLSNISEMTGTVIDSGDGVTHVFPVCDGYVISSCVKHIPLAGRDITNYTLQSLKDRGEQFKAGDANEIAAKIKEKYGYVCKDVLKEFNSFDKKTMDEATGQMVQSNKFKRFVHRTLNGNMVELDVGYERFLGPEMFFHPEFVHKDFMKPLGEVVDDAIQSCPTEYRIKLYNNIVLSGGSTLFKGFDTRLKGQVQNILDQRMALFNQISGSNETMSCEVAQNMVQRYAVWFGGSVLGSHEAFPQICKTREQYEEYGPSICRHNAISGSM